jgi:hypothetical protein
MSVSLGMKGGILKTFQWRKSVPIGPWPTMGHDAYRTDKPEAKKDKLCVRLDWLSADTHLSPAVRRESCCTVFLAYIFDPLAPMSVRRLYLSINCAMSLICILTRRVRRKKLFGGTVTVVTLLTHTSQNP